jgi:hypothetical protein
MTLLAKRIQRDHGWLFLTSVIQNLFVMPVKTGIQAGRMPYALQNSGFRVVHGLRQVAWNDARIAQRASKCFIHDAYPTL